MARVTGLEPATSGVTGRHSNQLSYTRAFHLLAHQGEKPCSKTAFPKADGGARQAGFAPSGAIFEAKVQSQPASPVMGTSSGPKPCPAPLESQLFRCFRH